MDRPFDAYIIGVTDLTLPDFFKTVTAPEVRLLTEIGDIIAAFDTSDTWWRQDLAEAFGEARLSDLNREETDG